MRHRGGSGIVGALVALSLASLALLATIELGRSVSVTRCGLEEHRLYGSVAMSVVEGLLAQRPAGLARLAKEPISADRLEGVSADHPIAGLVALMSRAKLLVTVARRSITSDVEVLVVTVKSSAAGPTGREEIAMGVLTNEP